MAIHFTLAELEVLSEELSLILGGVHSDPALVESILQKVVAEQVRRQKPALDPEARQGRVKWDRAGWKKGEETKR